MNGCAPTSSTSFTSISTTATPRMVCQLNPRASAIGLEVRAKEDAVHVDLPAGHDHRQFRQHRQRTELRRDAIERPPGVLEEDRVFAGMCLGIEPVVVLVDTREQARYI